MSTRIERANSQIQKALQQIIHLQMNDPRIDDFVGVSKVEVSPDFRHCKVKIAFTDGKYDRSEKVLNVLKNSEGFLKHKLSEMLDMPHVPKLEFIFDKNLQNAVRVDELLKKLNIPPIEKEGDDDE